MIRTYALLLVALLLAAVGVAYYTPGAALVVIGLGLGFIWWDSGDDQ